MSLIAWADSVDWSPCPREHRGACIADGPAHKAGFSVCPHGHMPLAINPTVIVSLR